MKVWILMAVFMGTLSASGKSCFISSNQLPLCQGDGFLVPKHEPAAVSFPPSQMSDKELGQLLLGLSRENSPTKLGLLKSQQQSLRSVDPRELGISKQQLEQLLNRHVFTFGNNEGHPISESDTQYMRDATIYGVDPSTGNLRISRSATPNKFTAYKSGSTFCGVPVIYNQQFHENNSNRGGNVIALPGGACLSAEGASSGFLDMVCGPGAKKIIVGRRGTNLGHVDELINVVPAPDKDPPCQFAVVVASQRKFNDVLKASPQKPFFGENGLRQVRAAELTNQCQSGQCTKTPSSLCQVLDRMSWLLRVENELAKSRTRPSGRSGQQDRGQSQNRYAPRDPPRMPAAASPIGEAVKQKAAAESFEAVERKAFPSLYAANRNFQAPDCARYRNQDVLRLYENKDQFQRLKGWLEDEGRSFLQEHAKDDHLRSKSLISKVEKGLKELEAYRKMAESFDAQQDESWKKIKEALPPECRETAQKVELPMGLDNGSLNPNPTNLQVVGKTALYPRQFNPELEIEIEKSLKALGLQPLSVNTFKRHTGGGNVHCLSNEIRTCRPR